MHGVVLWWLGKILLQNGTARRFLKADSNIVTIFAHHKSIGDELLHLRNQHASSGKSFDLYMIS